MKQRLKFFITYALFWLILFIAARLFFLLYQHSFSFDISIKEWLLTFIYGLRLDISTIGYILGLTGLILMVTFFLSGTIIHKILKPFILIVWIICSVIIVVDLELYRNWGFRMDATPLLYITKPKEAMASTELWLNVLLFLFAIGLAISGNIFYNKLLRNKVLQIKRGNIYTFLFLTLLTGSMIIPVRASFGIAPVNTGMVYFSKNKFSNHAAINVVWNVMNSLVYRKNTEKSYQFMPNEKAEKIVAELNSQSEKTKKVLKIDKPSIVILILESFSSKVIGALDGKWNSTPNFNQLANEGLLFTNFYANGDRSDKGLVSILSGYPAQPTTSIIKTSSKTETLPFLFKNFNQLGYESWFYYGGNIDFANMRSYFLNGETNHLITDQQFDKDLRDSKWGVQDEYLFEHLLNNMEAAKKPFFKVVFTLSSHDPFEVPMDPVFEGNDRATKYRNSIYYTDRCLGDFFNKVKKTELWDSTLFILVADHGSNRPGNSQNHELDKFRIPMLWLGGVLDTKIKKYKKPGSQIDLPNTLLSQISNYDTSYYFSKDLFSEDYSGFVFYAFNDGFGFVSDSSKIIFDNIGNSIIFQEGENTEKDLLRGKAYLQDLSNDYMKR
ncbi:MAG: sulfatase-like hydrolase/transferase [Bacteroidales bacterium]